MAVTVIYEPQLTPWADPITNLATNPSFETGSGTVEVRRNFVTNPSFEVDTSGWAAFGAAGVIARSTLASRTGAASLRISMSAGGANGVKSSPQYAVTANTAYTLSAYIQTPAGTATNAIEIAWYNGATLLSVSTATQPAAVPWGRISVTGTAPATANLAELRIYMPSGTTTDVRFVDDVLFEATPALLPYFDGSNGYGDADLTPAWVGAANASASVVRGVGIATYVTTQPIATGYQSSRWAGAGAKSLRIMPTWPTRGSSHTEIASSAAPRGLVAGQTYTALATFYQEAPQPFAGIAVARAMQLGNTPGGLNDAIVQAENIAGEQQLRLTFTIPASGSWRLRLYNGGMIGDPDAWWDELAIVEGVYDGPYFDGSLTDNDLRVYAWTGSADASTSTLVAREYRGTESAKPTSASTYTARMDATPISPTDRSAGTPTFSAGVPLGRAIDRYRQRGKGVAIRDNESRGIIQGIMDGFTSDEGGAVVSAVSPLNALVARVSIPAIFMGFDEFMEYLIGLVDPSLEVEVSPDLHGSVGLSIVGVTVRRPATNDTAWNILNEECLVHHAECVMNQGVITFRPIRGGVVTAKDVTTQSHDYEAGPSAEFVEIKSYGTTRLGVPEISQMDQFWPPRQQEWIPRSEQEDIISVGSGETVIVDIDLTDVASLTSVSQPVATSSTEPAPPSTSYYRVMDRDNNPVTAAWWTAGGGRMGAEIIDNGNAVRITVIAPVSELAPFQIAAPLYYPVPGKPISEPLYFLNLYGYGVKLSPEIHRFHTGAEPNTYTQEVGASIDIPGVAGSWEAIGLIQSVMAEYSAPRQAISGRLSNVVVAALSAEWLELSPEVSEDDKYQWYQDRLFVMLVGSRIRYEDSYYRITQVEFTEGEINFDAVADTTNMDVEELWDLAGLTYGDQEELVGDLTWEEWEAMPLYLGEGEPYGTGVYGEGVYGE